MFYKHKQREKKMNVYLFDRKIKGVWRKINTTDMPLGYKFVAWIYPEKSVMIVFDFIQSHKDMVKSAVRNDIDDICTKAPNAAGLCRNGKITEWHSTTLNLSSDADAVIAIKEFLKK